MDRGEEGGDVETGTAPRDKTSLVLAVTGNMSPENDGMAVRSLLLDHFFKRPPSLS